MLSENRLPYLNDIVLGTLMTGKLWFYDGSLMSASMQFQLYLYLAKFQVDTKSAQILYSVNLLVPKC